MPPNVEASDMDGGKKSTAPPAYELPQSLPGDITPGEEVVWTGIYSDIRKGVWVSGGEETRTVVCIKYIRKVRLKSDTPYSHDERFDRRLRREAGIWGSVQHPNILPFIGYVVLAGEHCLVSPWAEHGNLEKYALDHPGEPSATKRRLIQEATRGLKYLHDLELQIVHGDIKPANILLRAAGEDQQTLSATLCDFGVSRVMVELGLHTGLTTSGGAPGTSGYQAPELFADNPVDCRATPWSDIYAMGGVILMVMSGRKPFWNKQSDGAVILAIGRGEMCQPSNHPELPEGNPLWDLLRRCWDVDPSARPTAGQVVHELD